MTTYYVNRKTLEVTDPNLLAARSAGLFFDDPRAGEGLLAIRASVQIADEWRRIAWEPA